MQICFLTILGLLQKTHKTAYIVYKAQELLRPCAIWFVKGLRRTWGSHLVHAHFKIHKGRDSGVYLTILFPKTPVGAGT